ncbi:MAG: chemotaxis response regulator protein-glutamate methylesterase [Planctomycetes bacterium]|nr:chemotaxis response regulator protein-glutamate methylesterase [Planctomycetota bacterium]
MSLNAAKIRVLVVDRDPDLRAGLARRLERHPYVEIVGSAADSQTAIPKIAAFRPDWVILDLAGDPKDAAGMLEVMHEARIESRRAVITAGDPAFAGEQLALARSLGAAACVPRPTDLGLADLVENLGGGLLTPILRAAGVRLQTPARPAATTPAEPDRDEGSSVAAARAVRVVGIGVSTGGPMALNQLLPQIPASFPVPIVIVQHMPADFTQSLAASLDKVCPLPVREAVDGEPLLGGQVLIAPGGRQMRVARGAPQPVIRVTDDAPECSCRPSVDYLFRSLARTYGRGALGVVLTGMGEDAWMGSRAIHAAGGMLLAQDEASSAVFGMPRGPIEAGIAPAIGLQHMARVILSQVGAVR